MEKSDSTKIETIFDWIFNVSSIFFMDYVLKRLMLMDFKMFNIVLEIKLEGHCLWNFIGQYDFFGRTLD